ncbi:hypothetical protein [Thauera aminoaromatica]|uniref:hypothetical protein n=1 Tax=Thauera aminoaromatica TaxID=164330 RepID=UPI0023F1B95B|nr:hypothetical protein [Thauera aminoaromatica]
MEMGEGLAVAHADHVGLAERRDHLVTQRWRAVLQARAADAGVDQLRPGEEPPPGHIGGEAG